MSDVTRILSEIEGGDANAGEQLLPLIYDELRRLAAQKMAGESPDHTLQATALVHEAYVRLVDVDKPQHWNSRGHFFAAAAEAMRRILIEGARRKETLKHGGGRHRVGLTAAIMDAMEAPVVDLIALDQALEQLGDESPSRAALVKLRFFAGLTIDEAALALGISRATADRQWAFARAWLYCRLEGMEQYRKNS